MARLGGTDAERNRPDALDVAVDAVAGLHRPDTLGSSSENQIAGLEMIEERQIRDQLANGPDQLVEVGALARLAVHRELDRAALQHDARHGDDFGDNRRVLDVLSEIPGPAFVAGDELQVAPRHIEATGVAVDELVRMALVHKSAACGMGRSLE